MICSSSVRVGTSSGGMVAKDRSPGHGSVLRCLFAYLKGLAPKDIPKVMIERGDLVEITPVSSRFR